MELIKPEGDSKEEEKVHPLKCEFKGPQMNIELHLDLLDADPDGIYKLRGFMDSMRDQALLLINNVRQQKIKMNGIAKPNPGFFRHFRKK